MTVDLFPCEGCATRGFVYVEACERCAARRIARTPIGMVGYVWTKHKAMFATRAEFERMRNLIREERKADAEATT